MIGNYHTAQRIKNAENSFVQTLMEIGRISRFNAYRAFMALRKAKAIKLDPIGGRYLVKHGAFMAPDVIRRAAELCN